MTRDDRIRDLSQALAKRISGEDAPGQSCAGEENVMLRQLVADLERRLAGEARRRALLDERLAAAQNALAQERSGRIKAERDCEAFRVELNAAEASLASDAKAPPEEAPPTSLSRLAVLYVGGRPHQVYHLRATAERLGAAFLHHDGVVENHPNLLPGLTSQADVVLFPVDCVSHDATYAIKSLCQQAGKRHIPLRSASVTSLLAALQRPEVTGLADATD